MLGLKHVFNRVDLVEAKLVLVRIEKDGRFELLAERELVSWQSNISGGSSSVKLARWARNRGSEKIVGFGLLLGGDGDDSRGERETPGEIL